MNAATPPATVAAGAPAPPGGIKSIDPDPEAGPDPMVVDPPDPVEVVSDTEEPEEKGGMDLSEGDGDGGLFGPPPPRPLR